MTAGCAFLFWYNDLEFQGYIGVTFLNLRKARAHSVKIEKGSQLLTKLSV